MGSKINAGLLVLVSIIIFLCRRQRQRYTSAFRCGSMPPVAYQPKEPFGALGFQMGMHAHIPFVYKLHQQYGHTFQVRAWISLPTICTIDWENIRFINSSKDWGVESLRLPGWAHFFGRGLLTTDGETRSHARKLLKPSFDMRNISDLSAIGSEVDGFIGQLPKNGSTIDLQPLLRAMFLNSTLHFILGDHSLEQQHSAPITTGEFSKLFDSAFSYSVVRAVLGRAWNLLPQKRYLATCETAHKFIDYYIKQALDENDDQKRKGLIGQLSAHTSDVEFIRSQVLQTMLAARDTTSELLTNALFLLARNPSYWEQLRDEFASVLEDSLSVERLKGSRLATNILHETLRLYPAFPLVTRISRRDTVLPTGGGPNQDRSIFVQKGSMAVMALHALHRDRSIFGGDVEDFRPERWDEVNPSPWGFMAFGDGDRGCLGRGKVMLEAAYVLARLAQSFVKLESMDGRDWKGVMRFTWKNVNGCKVAM